MPRWIPHQEELESACKVANIRNFISKYGLRYHLVSVVIVLMVVKSIDLYESLFRGNPHLELPIELPTAMVGD